MEQSETTVPVCYKHPDRVTGLSCTRCDKPICVECSNDASVGQLCPDCAAPSDRHRVIQGRQIYGRPTFQTAPVSFTIMAITVAIFVAGMLSTDLDIWLTQYRGAYSGGQMPTPYYDANDGHPSYLLVNDGKGSTKYC